jgi:hypothetical protein
MLVTNANAPEECTECAEQNSRNAFSGISASSQWLHTRLSGSNQDLNFVLNLIEIQVHITFFLYGTVGFVLFPLILTSGTPGQSVKPHHPI